jgi:hypothetical protein
MNVITYGTECDGWLSGKNENDFRFFGNKEEERRKSKAFWKP